MISGAAVTGRQSETGSRRQVPCEADSKMPVRSCAVNGDAVVLRIGRVERRASCSTEYGAHFAFWHICIIPKLVVKAVRLSVCRNHGDERGRILVLVIFVRFKTDLEIKYNDVRQFF